MNGDGVLDVVLAGRNGSGDSAIAVRFGATKDGLAPLLSFSLSTQADALQAMGYLDQTLNNLAKQRGVIGSFQSRVSVALSTLAASRENFAAAGSRIQDADVSAESATLLRTQILQQAGAAVLAQANVQPQLAIQLLAG